MSPHSNDTQNVDTLIEPKWIVTMDANERVLENHTIAISGSTIVDILPSDEADRKYTSQHHFKLGEHAACPGLINAHGHAAMNLFKGMADDLGLMDWLNHHIWPAEAKFVDPEFVHDGTLLAIAEMLRSGTTFFSDMYFFPDMAAEVAYQHRIRTQVCFPVLDFPTQWASGPDEYIHKGIRLHDQYKGNDFVHVAFGPHAPYTVSDAPLKKVGTLAKQLDCKVQIHMHETAFEVEEALVNSKQRPLARMHELGLTSIDLQCVHMTQVDEKDIETLASTGTHVIHCPESNLKLASGFCPISRLMASGINVALGTDGSSSNNNLDMFEELHTAALLGKAVARDATAVKAMDALKMATINGAKALGVDAFTGSLETGKWADIIVVDFSQLEHQPVYDPVSHLVYCTSGKDVSHSWIGGVQHLHNKKLTMIDTVHLKMKARQWARKIRGESDQG
ncbi:MAG: N-ethylammeline chlorohydrolase [Gammaproteobacteria bacterium]|nr:MAG: N-ethylammeline chlorohydrolase [Pseudomonadota bacterium]PIE38451.1 MAG: N-ethylammeline chlorohydrolase [Gammaproteobacteria bacterium]